MKDSERSLFEERNKRFDDESDWFTVSARKEMFVASFTVGKNTDLSPFCRRSSIRFGRTDPSTHL